MKNSFSYLRVFISIGAICFFAVFLFAVGSLFISPSTFWVSGIVTLLIPSLYLVTLVLTIVLFFIKTLLKWVSLAFLISGIYFIPLFYGFNEEETGDISKQFTLLSYNISGYRHLGNKKIIDEIENWIMSESPDILCLQEYFPEKKEIRVKKIKGKGTEKKVLTLSYIDDYYPYQFLKAEKNMVGVVTFSKYPIVNEGVVFEGESSHNKGIFTDVVINSDTVRIINIHLESNNLALYQFRGDFFHSLKILKMNQAIRSKQIEKIKEFIQASDKKVIVAGDFNETQFSYVFFRLRDVLHSSFERKGEGLGLTFRPEKTFLRIDHQFYSDGLEVLGYKTLTQVPYSDHKPVKGIYRSN